MTARLLFCIAEEAKPFTRMASNIEMEGDGPKVFTVVKSRDLVVNNRMAELRKGGLTGTEDFQTEFIGASVRDCQE
ncbi:uncharacterized protein RCC_02929 [Ramularia collo-cygni]|uniref:Uncharacterized protein n=1 Tax=Ramularia collo-cygni TaxID=112498 RepID=A0A2D3UXR4_9PEZI|nr:uncharacterized protein RCC_02929 [Ramularia collo-cygni]CZT17097.1 uncharacterized protein RCC_02929 [Ramularia collo-cygni]